MIILLRDILPHRPRRPRIVAAQPVVVLEPWVVVDDFAPGTAGGEFGARGLVPVEVVRVGRRAAGVFAEEEVVLGEDLLWGRGGVCHWSVMERWRVRWGWRLFVGNFGVRYGR